MDLTQVETALNKLFQGDTDRPAHRVVFWNDPDREFQNDLPFIVANLDNVNLLHLEQIGTLEAKVVIERREPELRHLVYSPTPIPSQEADWLLDIRLYSAPFSADAASILLNELGLKRMSLREHLARRKKFFANKERNAKLRALVHPEDREVELDRKMMAVAVRVELPDLFQILRAVFHEMVDAETDAVDLEAEPKPWEELSKLELTGAFWKEIAETFHYTNPTPTLRDLLIRLLVSDFAASLGGALPNALKHFQLEKAGATNAVVFLGQWRDSSAYARSYDALSDGASRELNIPSYLADLELEAVLGVLTFLDVEKTIASALRDRIRTTADHINTEEIFEITSRRQAGHWISPTAPPSFVRRDALRAVYHALEAAAEWFDLRNQHAQGFKFDDAASLYGAYTTELYRFDQLYRHFCEAADFAESEGWDILKPLREDVCNGYANWFIPKLSLKWGQFVDPAEPDSLLGKWRIPNIPNQQEFYKRKVESLLKQDERRKVFVIISDAFRYEAAQELQSELNGKYRFKAELSSQLGVLPSYTSLGMASLLPHGELAYSEKGDVTVDGKTVASLDQRAEILAGVKGIAVKADELTKLSNAAGRDLVRDASVVYIYHNRVDAIGDAASTESQTFEAVRDAIDEINDLVRYVINSLNGSQVYVTADHGFLFQEHYPDETHKSKLAEKPEHAIKSKKRYVIGRDLPKDESVWHGYMEATAGAKGGMEFWIPKGASLFHFVGGARFVHGGAMLQEIVVPVMFVQEAQGKSKEESKVKKVEVHVLGSNHKITTNRHRFELLQMEAISDRVKPVTLKVAVYDGDEPVTNIETVTFDSTSGTMDDRKKWVSLVLLTREYDKTTEYRLVLRDAETQVERQAIPVKIDRAFTNDF